MDPKSAKTSLELTEGEFVGRLRNMNACSERGQRHPQQVVDIWYKNYEEGSLGCDWLFSAL